jgi:tetratricopeptide (TPR) repeat protein
MMKPFLLKVTQITAVTLAGLLLFGCMRSPEEKSATFMETGKKLLKDNDASRAILQFRNAAVATPNNPDVYYQLSLAYFAVGDIKTSIGVLRKALQLNPKHIPARLRMAQIMSSASDPSYVKEAREALQQLLREVPDDVQALHSLAFTELKLGEPEDALTHLTQSMALAPEDLTVAITLARARLHQKDAAGAEAVLKAVAQNSRTPAEAAVVLASFYALQVRLDAAEQEFRRAVNLDSDNGMALHGLATVLNKMGRKGEAEETFKKLARLPNRRFRDKHAIFLFEEGRRDEAIRELEDLVKQDSEDRSTRTQLIAAYRTMNRTSEAEGLLDTALKRNPKDSEALLQRAELMLMVKKYDAAQADLTNVLRFQPDWAEAHYHRAKLHQARGESRIYREGLYKALQLSPTLLPVRLEAAGDLIAKNDAKAAIALLDEAPEFQRNLPQTIVQRNWGHWALGDLTQMRKGIDAGLSAGPGADLLLQDGLWNLRNGKVAEARRSLEKALNINPQDIRALGALKQAYQQQKQNSAGVQKVRDYALQQPQSAPVQEFFGVLLMAEGDSKQARAAFVQAKRADPTFVKADLRLVQMDMLEGRVDDAKRRLEELLAGGQEKTTARLWLGNLETTRGNHKVALERFREVLTAEPNNPQALNNYAYLLAESANNPAEALKYAQRAKELAPNDLEYWDTLGWILYRKGLYQNAVSELERVTAAKAGNPVWMYHLAMAYVKAGDVKRGRATLNHALKLNPNLPEAKMAQEVIATARL